MSLTAKLVRACITKRNGIALALAVIALTGCGNEIPRMNSNFNGQKPGAPPEQFPLPRPKAQFTWLVRQPLKSTVVANPSGGNWVMTVPLREFIADPDLRRTFLLASSEPFTTSPIPNIRGTFSLRIVGQGEVSFGLRAVARETNFVGGGALDSFARDIGGVGFANNPDLIDYVMEGDRARGFPGTGIAEYKTGQTVAFLYNIDQASHTFHLGVIGGGGTLGGADTTYRSSGPIAYLELWLWLRRVEAGTQVYVNNIEMYELR